MFRRRSILFKINLKAPINVSVTVLKCGCACAAAVAFGSNEFGQLARGPAAQSLRNLDPKAMQVDHSKPFLQGQVHITVSFFIYVCMYIAVMSLHKHSPIYLAVYTCTCI